MQNILVIGDTHCPFEHKKYLDFCCKTRDKFKCSIIIHIGDLVDLHSISAHEHSPDGFSPFQEHQEALKHLRKWYKAFPKVTLLIGNHDERIEKAAFEQGLSRVYFKSFQEIWEFPKGWDYRFDCYYYGIRFFHGMGYSGKYAHISAAQENRQSVVIGHLHANGGVEWSANENSIIFGLAVGCGVDRNSYAFRYGRDYKRKPILGCGVITDSGKNAQFVPMEM